MCLSSLFLSVVVFVVVSVLLVGRYWLSVVCCMFRVVCCGLSLCGVVVGWLLIVVVMCVLFAYLDCLCLLVVVVCCLMSVAFLWCAVCC